MATVDSVTRVRPVDAEKPGVLIWSWVGIAILAFQIFVLGKWISGPHFLPTDPGTDLQPEATRLAGIAAQIAAVILGSVFVWFVVVRDRLRSGEWSTTALLGICWCAMWFWDPMMNYTSTLLLYNSHLVNFGSWTLGSTPGWISPNGNLLPEPLLIIMPGYPMFCFGQVLLTLWLLRRCRQKWSGLSKLSMVGIAVAFMTFTDGAVEMMLIKTGLYVFPGGIPALTLWYGQPDQFPLTEAFFFGGMAQTATLLLLLYRDDKGQSFVERGIDKLHFAAPRANRVRFLALYGYSHLMLVALWVAPSQLVGLNAGAYPKGYPSYLINHMCAYGVNRDQCPGPGVMIPRPD